MSALQTRVFTEVKARPQTAGATRPGQPTILSNELFYIAETCKHTPCTPFLPQIDEVRWKDVATRIQQVRVRA
jgi:hypothetical protein